MKEKFMKAKLKSVSAVLLAGLLLMTSILVSCSTNTPSISDDSNTTQVGTDNSGGEEYDGPLPDLPAVKYDGTTFRILTRTAGEYVDTQWPNDILVEESGQDHISSAIYDRRLYMEEKYGIEFDLMTIDESVMQGEVLNAVRGGNDEYDIIMNEGRIGFIYASNGVLLDWNTNMTYCDLDQPWWNASAREAFSIGDRLYCMIGDMSYLSLSFAWALYFNKQLVKDYNLEEPYELVKNFEWTFDEFYEMATSCHDDLNGDGVMNYDDDLFGYATNQYGGAVQVIYSAGEKLISNDEDGYPYASYYKQSVVDAYDTFFSLVDMDTNFIYTSVEGRDGPSFENNRALFMDTYVGLMLDLRDMEADFGVVPYPNFNENEDRYYAHVSVVSHVINIPVTAYDRRDMISVLLEDMSYYGHRYIIPAFYDTVLTNQQTRDEETKQMLPYIKDGRVYDLGFFEVSLGEVSGLGATIANLTNHSLATWHGKNERLVEKKLENLIEKYTGIE